MAVIKHIAIHRSPMKLMNYILQNGKTDKNTLVTGMLCSTEPEKAYKEFEWIYERFSGERFYNGTQEGVKKNIKIHHYIQSFEPGEVTPEEAHKIAVEWARKVFGDHRQVLISTHIDKGHIHTHLAVAVYDCRGKRWIDNKETLKHCRDVSDRICKAHGLSVIKNPSRDRNHKYAEWKARQEKRCWKDRLRDDIDKLILKDDVQSIDDLIAKLRAKKYIVTYGKYISVRSPKAKHGIRTFRLGDGYALEELKFRIANKEQEMSIEKAMSYQGIQREYALCLRQMQIVVYRHERYPRKVTLREVRQNAELLQYICEKKIRTEEDFKNLVDESFRIYSDLKDEQEQLMSQIGETRKLTQDIPEFLEIIHSGDMSKEQRKRLKELSYLFDMNVSSADDAFEYEEELKGLEEKQEKISAELKNAESENRLAAMYYENYLRTVQTDYDILLERAKREYLENAEIKERELSAYRERTESEISAGQHYRR